MKKIIAATKNKNKVIEFERILSPLGYKVLSQSDAGIELEVGETGETFEQNAYLKAAAIFQASGVAVIADDSGLEVDYIDKAPGVYSARFCGKDTPYSVKNAAILEKLKEAPEERRTARFVCAICYINPKGDVIKINKTCEGKIAHTQKGINGFGYDPIFIPVNGSKTTAEMNEQEKDAVSHRGKALRSLAEELELRLDF
ncbi:MAG: RdgB/HAM1 family non-canonical purine NTP pyrophosphatase [Oscillospiraceae bacterium]|nr:RdgB/HAM1 family non-canonical purine NTP pyrophosphatase [Oscillospiraceae bacterium]